MKSIIYLGMDVHTTNYTLCCYTLEDDRMCHLQQIAPDYRLILKYMDQVRRLYNNDVEFLCGYEAGCLGYSLYHQLTAHQVRCVILAPTTMGAVLGIRKVKPINGMPCLSRNVWLSIPTTLFISLPRRRNR